MAVFNLNILGLHNISVHLKHDLGQDTDSKCLVKATSPLRDWALLDVLTCNFRNSQNAKVI